MQDRAEQVAVAVPGLLAMAAITSHAWGWLQDRMEDRLDEPQEMKTRRLMVRYHRHSLTRAQARELRKDGTLGRNMRALFTAVYSRTLERDIRRALPGGQPL